MSPVDEAADLATAVGCSSRGKLQVHVSPALAEQSMEQSLSELLSMDSARGWADMNGRRMPRSSDSVAATRVGALRAHLQSSAASISRQAAPPGTCLAEPAVEAGAKTVYDVSRPNRRIVAIGGGQAADKPWIRDEIISMTGKPRPAVVYLGTPSYDRPAGFERQAAGFKAVGLPTVHLNLTDLGRLPSPADIAETLRNADIIVVSGGNPLFSIRRWRKLGVDELLRQAMDRGTVLCGGSCGAVCWFDAAWSDALAPTTVHPDHRDRTLVEGVGKALDWSYSRVKCLGFVEGILCPHHDAFEKRANISREESFDAALMVNAGEVGLAVDNNAALVIEGDHWRVVTAGGKVYKKIFDNGALAKTELLPHKPLQPLAELFALPDFLSLTPPT